MAKLDVSPTKSNLLALRRQLEFAEEGYDLLDQKRQILVFELMSRLERARQAEQRLADALRLAYEALREAHLDLGVSGLDRAILAVRMAHGAQISLQPMMGMRIPHVSSQVEPARVQFGLSGTSANADLAMRRFVQVLPLLSELAELENAVIRLARELRKTQRRCNALSKIFIPAHQETITYITSSLEERERESFTILKMIRNRLARANEPASDQRESGDAGGNT